MKNNQFIKAVIFDMDGVIINSEPLWQIAEKNIFSK
jgi:sugar-phosphatase